MISIITSIYKSDRHLKFYLKKVEYFKKNAKDLLFEIYVISNDPSIYEKEILEEFSKKHSFFRVTYVERETLYQSWNRGIEKTQYPIITFWNVDDIRSPNAVKDGINKIKNGSDIIYFPFIYKRYIRIFNIPILIKYKKIIPPEFDYSIFTHGMHCGPFFMFTKKAYEKVGIFNPTFKIAGDFDWCVRAAKSGLVFSKSQVEAGIFSNDGTTLSGSQNNLQCAENSRVLDILKK